MRRPAAIAARILIAGLIGAAVTVGVAAGCAMLDDPPSCQPSGWEFRRVTPERWVVKGEEQRRSHLTRRGLLRGFGSSLLPYLDTPLTSTIWYPSKAIESMRPGGTRYIQVAGWPSECIWGAIDITPGEAVQGMKHAQSAKAPAMTAIGALSVGRPPNVLDPRGIGGYLPIAPIWPGLALNTLFYGAIAWAILFLPGTMRRWRRLRGGRCIACGYDRAGLAKDAKCPECGQSAG